VTARQATDVVVCALGVLMVIAYAVAMWHQAGTDPYSVWCDPKVTACVHHQ
jgi:hypothetical protein